MRLDLLAETPGVDVASRQAQLGSDVLRCLTTTDLSLVEQMTAAMQPHGVPTAVFQNGVRILLGADTAGQISFKQRPYAVFEIENASQEPAIFKMVVNHERKKHAVRINREIAMLGVVLPEFGVGLDASEEKRVRLPRLVASESNVFSIQEKMDGAAIGTPHELTDASVDAADVKTVAEFIFKFSEFAASFDWQKAGLGLKAPKWRRYKMHRHAWQEVAVYFAHDPLHEEKVEAAMRLGKQLLKGRAEHMVAGDIHPGNIIRCPDDRLGFIDWERVHLDKNPAAEYSPFLVALASQPDLQRTFIDYAIEVNRDEPAFRDLLRLDYIGFRGLLSLLDWHKLAQADTATPDTREHAQKQAHVVAASLQEALEATGSWAKH